tara:strand:- start:12663 stop:13157 length:495 start_codon:yes stop_codon:yes gene_type:complete
MKFMKMKITSILTIIMYVVTVASCSGDDNNDDNNQNDTSANQTTEIAQTGTWRITQFIDSGDDETSDFNGFVFTFNSDGTVIANRDELSVSGTWSVNDSSNSSDDDDGSSNDIDFNLFFDVPETNDFEDLNDDWDLVSASNSKIELIDVSGGNGGTDNLIFEKI